MRIQPINYITVRIDQSYVYVCVLKQLIFCQYRQMNNINSMADHEDELIHSEATEWSHFFLQREQVLHFPQAVGNLEEPLEPIFQDSYEVDMKPVKSNQTHYQDSIASFQSFNHPEESIWLNDTKINNFVQNFGQQNYHPFYQNLQMQVKEEKKIKKQEKEDKEEVNLEITEQEAIFHSKQLKGLWRKNTNIPKFIVRIFLKYFKKHAQEDEAALIEHYQKVAAELQGRSTNNYSIPDVNSLLGDKCENLRMKNQQILSKIIQSVLREEVLQNKYIKGNHKSYMVAMKVYSLRCRSRELTQRVKFL